MRRLITVLCLMMSTGECIPQAGTGYIDSLIQVLKKKSVPDTTRVTPLLNLSDAIVFNNSDTAMKLAREALGISEKLKWQKGIALSYRQIGTVHYVLSDNLSAMDYYQKALKAGESLHNKMFEASLYNNLANIYSDLKQFEKALEYYNRFYENAKSSNLVKEQTIALINIGTVYTEMKNFSGAIAVFKQSLTLAEQAKNEKLIPMILNNIGITLDSQGDNVSALNYFKQSIKSADQSGSENAKSPAFEGMSKIYLREGNYALAEQYANKSLSLAQKLGSPDWQSNAWQTLSGIYEKQKKFDRSLDAYKKYILFRDSVLNEENKSELTRKELQFGYEKKEAVLKSDQDRKETLAAAAINRQTLIRNFILTAVLLLLIAALWSFSLYKRKRDADLKRKEAEFAVAATETEMKVLRLQMNPHFIFNTLNSISDFISKYDTQAADDYLTKFSKVMRMTLEHADQREIPLEDDLKMLELYLQLESKRLAQKFGYAIRVDDSIDLKNTMIPPMILQPFVENSIWHGVSKKDTGGLIDIEIKRDGNMIHCIIEDNGGGRHQTDLSPGLNGARKKSYGIRTTRERINILNKDKPSRGGIDLSDTEVGTRVDIRLPYVNMFE